MHNLDESTILRVKRFIFFNVKYVAYALWILAFVSMPFIALRLLPSVADILRTWNIDLEKGPLQGSLAMSLFAAVIAALSGRAWMPYFQRWVSQRTLPINTEIRERHLEQCELYNDAISLRIKSLLPEELRLSWQDSSTRNQFLIPTRAEELASTETRRAPAGRIKDLSRFLDLEFFFNVRERVQPITIQGEPGSGKSTLIFDLYRQQANRLQTRKQGWIPILVFAHELSWEMLSVQTSLKSLLVAYFKKCFEEYRHAGYESICQFLNDHYDEYQFVIIVDGLDEITNRPLYEKMTKRLNELLEKEWFQISGDSNANRYIVSCRTDDNQHTITSRLVSLLPLDYESVMAHLRRLRKAFNKESDPKELQIRNVIRGLQTSKANRLLQNYIRNPYLLSLIREYYQEQENPPARTLAQVFAQVLQRELSKPREDFEGKAKREDRVQLLGYLSSVLAPYCYVRTIDTLVEGKTDEEDFSRYIKKDEALANILFGNVGEMGYIQGVYQDNSLIRENKIRELTKIWGDDKTTEFRDFLTRIKTSTQSLNEFINQSVSYLHEDVLELLRICSLAEIDDSTGVIKRFRHRRMQDYFMALFVDRIGLSGEGAVVFPLGNAWMREPIRILAAISPKPEQLISSFNDGYRSLQDSQSTQESKHLSNLTDLMLNASEAIAYLPRPQEKNQQAPLYRLVVTLGIEAQHLYFQASQKIGLSAKGERRGWLDLLEKCLEILRNIYASEYLRNDKSIFNTSFSVDSNVRKNSWEVLHEQIQWEPDSYQHMAYSYLYPIRRFQPRFPISGPSLFFYVADAVLCFPAAYDRLVKETHPKARTRFPIWIGSALETISSVALIALILILAWGQVDDSQSAEFKAFKIGIALGIGFICAWGAQIFGLMRWSEFHHAPNWIVLKLGKKSFLVAKIVVPILMKLPFKIISFLISNFLPFIRFILRDLLPSVGELIRDVLTELGLLARKIIRNPKPFLLLAIIIVTLATLWIYVVPAAIDAVGAWEYRSSVARFNERVQAIDARYLMRKDEIEQLGTSSISEVDSEKQKKLMSELEQQDKDVFALMSQGQSLAESGQKYSVKQKEVINQTEKLKLRKKDIARLQGILVDKGKIFKWESRFQTFKDNLSRADSEISRLSSIKQDEPSMAEVQSQLDQIDESLRKISDLQKEGESLTAYSKRRSEIASLNTGITEKKNKLERVRRSMPSSPAPTADIRTVLTERSTQLLARTTLTDLGPKLTVLNETLDSEERRLKSVKVRLNVPSVWWPPAFYENYQVKRDLKYIEQIQSVESNAPLMQRLLADYAGEISAHLSNLKATNQPNTEQGLLEGRMSEIGRYQKQLEQFLALQTNLKVEDIHSALLSKQQENDEQLSRQRDRLLYVLLFIPVLLIGLVIARHFGDKSGEKRLRSIMSDYHNLLEFVRKNGYSLDVNVHAIAYLNKTALPSYRTLKQISDAAEERLRKPGEVNERIGYLLRDVAKGIDNILNRQSL
jgi:hypothetical protein